jgi:hypothetical protein
MFLIERSNVLDVGATCCADSVAAERSAIGVKRKRRK